MVPASLGVVDALPTTVGGKLDRAALPRLDETVAGPARSRRAAHHRRGDDRRRDAGGPHAAARGVDPRRLLRRPGRRLARGRAAGDAPARDSGDGAAGDARRLRGAHRRRPGGARPSAAAGPRRLARRRPALASTARVVAATAVQTAWILGELAVVATLAWIVVVAASCRGSTPAPAWPASSSRCRSLLGAVSAVWAPVAVLLTAAASRVLLGRCRAGRVPAWGSLHVRCGSSSGWPRAFPGTRWPARMRSP